MSVRVRLWSGFVAEVFRIETDLSRCLSRTFCFYLLILFDIGIVDR